MKIDVDTPVMQCWGPDKQAWKFISNMSRKDLPKKPPRRRNDKADVILFIVVYFCLILYAQFYSNTTNFCMAILYAVFILLPVIMIRLWIALREIILWNRLYSNLSNIVMMSIYLRHWLSFVMALFINITYMGHCLLSTNQPLKEVLSVKPFGLVDIIVALFIIILGLVFKWYETPMTESYRIEEPLSFSGGSSMAFSFYFGYLKIILKDFPKKIQDFVDDEKVDKNKVPVKKLFILIPCSSQVINIPFQPDLRPITDKLQSHREDRGMVMGREYKNTIYQIYDKYEKVKYILPVEYATPLKTFYETIDSVNGSKFKDFRREVVTSFYYTLEKIVNEDKEMKEKVELIYYNDEKPESSDLSSLLKRRIKYLMKLKKES